MPPSAWRPTTHAATYNGTTWSAGSDIDGTTGLDGVSCPTSSFCAAVDAAGGALTFNGTTWSTTDVDGTTVLNAVSCPSAGFCEAVDNMGGVVTYTGTTSTAQLTWDTTGSLALLLSDSANDYVFAPNGEPVEQIDLATSTPTYLTYNSSDDSWLATNDSGQQAAYWDYDAFGSLAQGTPDSPFGFAGQYSDASTGLVNDRARFYEPQTGSFTTRDPAFSSTDQAYVYAGSDPVNNSDPSGLNWCDFSPIGCGSLPGGRPGSPNGTNINYTLQGSETGEQYWEHQFCNSLVGSPGLGLWCSSGGGGSVSGQGPIETADLNRGRFQAQGGGVEESVSWSSYIVPTVSDGLNMLADLGQLLSKSEFGQRQGALQKAGNYVQNVCGPAGGCPPLSKQFYSNPTMQAKGIRVDLEIITGIAFIPDIVNQQGTETSFTTPNNCDSLTTA